MGMSEASKESKKSKDRSDSISSQQDGSQSSPGKSSRKLQDPPESKMSESLSSVSGQESESSSSKSETKSKLRKFKEGLGFGSKKGATEEALSPDSRRFSDAFVVQKFKDLEARRSSTQLEVPTQFRKSKNRSPSESPRRSPEDSRRESTDSRISASSLIQAALGRPTQVDTVPVSSLPAITIQADTPQTENAHNNNGRPLGATSALPPLPSSTRGRPRLQDVQQSSTESSADPDYRPISGIRKLPLSSSSAISSTSEDRRGSSQSESSRVSLATHKSVTFSDHIQVTEIERKERELEEEHSSSSEEESSIVSTRPVHVRRKRSDEETAVPGFSDGYHSEDVNPAHQEDYALKYDSDESNTVQYSYAYEAPSASSSSSADVDSGVLEQPDAPLRKEHEATGSIQASETTLPPSQSLQSVYREDELGPDYQTEFTLNQLNLLPEKVREAVLHELMESGYSGQDINVPMSGSMTRLHAEDSRSPSVASFQGFPRSASGYLDNPDLSPMYQHYPQIGGERQLEQERSQSTPPQEDQRLKGIDESFYDNVPSTSQITSPAHQKPPSGRPKTFRFSTNLHGEDGASSSSISPETPEEETEMRKKFVALYGNRRAPIANASDTEECPKDPAPSDRRGSASGFSTDSWESIVSATSMRAESKLRRNFNY
ncbi:hypothetical protein L596_015819 [Steinernema carpocapsae]|uniref:Uncharacterized protein n=1 Tax=Steinernema carpocapsae TaxID=34508 RepID=A0A4U5NH55_STECR|nr:hypothetical protein L596_015819 [Steinernema carpocapsae]